MISKTFRYVLISSIVVFATATLSLPDVHAANFSSGDRVQATDRLNVRSSPNGTLVGTQPLNAQGTILSGPQTAGGFTWWQVDYDSGHDGWSVENYLVKVFISTPGPYPSPTPTLITGSTITIDGALQHQTIDGFGSSVALFDDPHLCNIANNLRCKVPLSVQQQILQDIFTTLGLTRVRTGSVRSDAMLESVNDNSNPLVFDWTKFNINAMDERVEYVKQAQSYGLTTHFPHGKEELWMIPATNISSFIEEYVERSLAILIRMKELGFEAPYYSVKNEPIYDEPAIWTDPSVMTRVVKRLGERMRAEGIQTKLVIPDELGSIKAYYLSSAVMADPEARQYVGALAYHMYESSRATQIQMRDLGKQYNVPVWMTEWAIDPKGFAGGWNWANAIHDLIATYDVNAVDHMFAFFGDWAIARDDSEQYINIQFDSSGNYLGHSRGPKFYFAGQYTRFVRPGAIRLDAQSGNAGLKVTAFRHPATGVFTVVVINSGLGDKTATFTIKNLSATSFPTVYRTSRTENWATLPAVFLSNGTFSTTIKAESVTTFTTSGVIISPPTDTISPSVPSGLSASAISSTQINLSWNASTDPSSPSGQVTSGVTGYKIFRNGTQIATANTTSYQNNGLSPSTTYIYTVAAYDAAGNTSAQSIAVSRATLAVTTPPDTTSPMLSAIGSHNLTTSGALILWTSNEPSTSRVEYGLSTAYGNAMPTDTVLTTAHRQKLSGLNPGTLYHYRVQSQDAAGNTANSSDQTFTTLGILPPPPTDTISPSVPSGLSASAISSTQINLFWNASTDNVGVTGYKIFRNGTQIATTNAISYQDTGLLASTAYAYQVSAYDVIGNTSLFSSSVSVTTSAPVTTSKFSSGDRVKTTDILNVRATPGGTHLGKQPLGAQGAVTSGPQTAGGLTWWQVDYDTGHDGWSTEHFLVKVHTSEAPVSAPNKEVVREPSSKSSGVFAALLSGVFDAYQSLWKALLGRLTR